ncbi:MAG TPA: hydroxymethylbilane synthase, partial [Pseudomonadales bacterium]|nr:hydroxymethylbilane synthase [Pseudomonadales bacterium]
IREHLDTDICLPAAGQGAVGIECASDAADVKALLAAINHDDTSVCVRAERMISAGLGADCTLPIGAYAQLRGDEICISGFVSDIQGDNFAQGFAEGPRMDARELALDVTQQLISQGADKLISAE